MARHLVKILALLLIVATGVYLATSLGGKKAKSPAITTVASSVDQETAVDSPDGKLTLTMLEQKNKDTTAYIFSVAGKQIFSQTVGAGQTFFIPHNTWSPDYKYVFLKEGSPTQSRYFVLTSSGASITKDSQTLEIAELFAKKYPDYKITDVTGWAAPTLIIVNSAKADSTQGPSFWFEIPSGGFTQLSSHF